MFKKTAVLILTLFFMGIGSITCGYAEAIDTDGDGIHDDGDNSGTAGDNPCSDGNTSNCDDNCRLTINPDQSDMNSDGEGDVCDDTDNDGRMDAYDECPLTPPAMVSGIYYPAFQNAYNAALHGDTIKCQDVVFFEDMDLSVNKPVTLKGGYDCYYNDPPAGTTIFNGSTMISNGIITLESGRFVTAHGGFVSIMPIGDSITRGGGYPIGALDYPTYRYYLHNMLNDSGWEVDYVGPYNGVGDEFNTVTENPYDVPPASQDTGHPTFPDQDLVGSTGWTIDAFLSGEMSAKTLVEQYDPDIVLVHLGTNDLGGRSDTPAEAAAEIGQLIDLIRDGSLNAVIFVAQIIPLMDNAYGVGPGEYQAVQDFNALLPVVVSQKNQAAGYIPVVLIDMWTGFDPNTMLAELTHPNDAGDKEMAFRWYDGLMTNSIAMGN